VKLKSMKNLIRIDPDLRTPILCTQNSAFLANTVKIAMWLDCTEEVQIRVFNNRFINIFLFNPLNGTEKKKEKTKKKEYFFHPFSSFFK
jgi:hypothetical protein